MKKLLGILPLLVILIAFGISLYFYPQMPQQVPSHWNINGQVDGYMSKFWGMFFMPILSIVIYLLFLVLPKIDPKNENIKKFRPYFDGFIVIFMLFLLGIHSFTILWALGYQFSIIKFMSVSLAVLFYYIGVLIEKAEPNWSIGLRTPWTMSSPIVWEKTHKLGSKIYKAGAILMLLGLFFSSWAFAIVIGLAILSSLFLTVYSYLEYRKLSK